MSGNGPAEGFITPSWDDLRVLLAVERAGSFKAAGQRLGLSTSTVSRRLDALEHALGRRVVRRLAEGALVDPSARPLIRLAEQVHRELPVALRDAEAQGEHGGLVTVSLGPGFLGPVVRAVARVRLELPAVRFELKVDARVADLSRREADVAIRTGRVPADGVVYTRVGPIEFGVFGSRRYLERRGTDLSDLTAHDVIGYSGELARLPVMGWLARLGVSTFAVRCSTTESVLACAAADQGLAVVPVVQARAVPELVPLAAPRPPPGKEIHVGMHRDVRTLPRVRAFTRAVQAELKAQLLGG